MTAIPNALKHTISNPCGVCNGYESGKSGSGEHCWGFTREDQKYVNCTRADHAGSLTINANSETYGHYMVGQCNCGKNHLGSFTAPPPSTYSNSKSTPTPKQEVIDYDNPVATYEYETGFQVYRLKVGDGSGKDTFRQGHVVDGKTVMNLDGITTCLFHQKELEAAELSETVYVVEGEKDVLNAESKGLVATCNPMGAGKWRDHYNEPFTGRTVVIIEDNDEAGRNHVQDVAAGISPVATSVKIVRFPDERKGFDFSDWLEGGGTREQLNKLIENAPEWTATEVVSEASEPWGDMQELLSATPPVPTLDPELLPETFRAWLVDAAAASSVPLEMVAMPALSGIGSVIGRQLGIHPQQFDNFTALCNIWGGIVARPSKFKSSAVKEALSSVEALESSASDEYEESSASREAEEVFLKAETDAVHGLIKKDAEGKSNGKASGVSVNSVNNSEGLKIDLAKLIEKKNKASVTPRRFWTQDATFEKAGMILKENPNGIAIVRDELAGWWQGLDRAGRETERTGMLTSWSGTSTYIFDRVGRGTVSAPLCLTVTGSIQPGKLKRYIAEAISGGGGADGLLQRFQLLVYPDEASFPKFKPAEGWGDMEAKKKADAVYIRLAEIDTSHLGEVEPNKIPAVHYTEDAQMLATEARTQLEERLEGMGDAPAFESHMGKYRSLVPALALEFYLIDLPAGQAIGSVPVEPLKKALGMCHFLEAHARKIYVTELNPGLESAFAMSKKILSGAIKDGDSIRDIYVHGWADLTEAKDAYAAVEVLERLGWVRTVTEPTAGRSTTTLSLHPELLKEKTNG